MAKEKLIRLVRERPYLWDKSDFGYTRRERVAAGWHEIARELNLPDFEVKRRWRSLRDSYSKLLRRMPAGVSDEEMVASATWRYFPKLMFLRDTIALKPLRRSELLTYEYIDEDVEEVIAAVGASGSGGGGGVDALGSGSERSCSPDAADSRDPLHGPAAAAAPAAGVENADLKQEDSWASSAEEGSSKRSLWEENGMDADAQFLMSLVPFLGAVPLRRKLAVRARLAHVLMHELDQLDSERVHGDHTY